MKVVAIKCPSCKGSGKFMSLKFTCLWCKGELKLRKAAALRFADQLVTLGVGGFICGDHDIADQKKMLREADQICKLFSEPVIAPEYVR